MNITEAQEFRKYAVKHHGLSSMHLDNYVKKVYSAGGVQNLTRLLLKKGKCLFAR